MVRFERTGAVGEIVVSFTQMTPPFNSLEVYGSRGTIIENHMWERPVRIYSYDESMGEHRQQWYEPEIEHAPFPRYYSISVRHADEHFAECVLEDRNRNQPPRGEERDSRVLMGYLSIRTVARRPVTI